jgi:hypothetical protein
MKHGAGHIDFHMNEAMVDRSRHRFATMTTWRSRVVSLYRNNEEGAMTMAEQSSCNLTAFAKTGG